MREIVVIGVGAGDPEQLTMQAVAALKRVDVFFVLDKGEVKQELVDLRRRSCDAYARGTYRVVVGRDPERDRTTSAYAEAVDDWRRAPGRRLRAADRGGAGRGSGRRVPGLG